MALGEASAVIDADGAELGGVAVFSHPTEGFEMTFVRILLKVIKQLAILRATPLMERL